MLKTFADFDVDDRVCAALAAAGIVNPFPIQELTLPLALAGADLIGQARTGTGKTLAFGIPLVQRALAATDRGPVSLVIVPTRELCLQVRDDLAAASAQTDVEVLAVYGGKAIDVQIDALHKGVDIVVGTPGRLLDLLNRGDLKLDGVTGLVLDEADEMLDLGFLPDVEQLIQATATQRQTLLFSATMPSAVVALARRYMNKPTFMRADVEEVRIGPDTVQHFFSCHRMDKPAVLARILSSPGRGLCVVFSRTKRMADVLVEDLRSQGVNAAAIHSDLRQDARERALKSFRTGSTDVLVATEVAARGLDISDVTHVVNYDCPDDEKMYLHRIGRTGRAGAAGVAITLAVWNELARLEMIKKALGITQETLEVFSTSPILQELFDLPPQERARTSAPPAPTPAKTPRPSRRTRRPKADAVTDTSQPSDTEPAQPADEGPAVRRVRTRRRAAAAASPRPAAPPPERTERAAADEPTDGREPSEDQAPAQQARGTAKSTPERQPAPAARGNRGRRPERSSTRTDQRRGRTSRPARARAAEPIDSTAARGTGRPRLARPLEIVFLP